MTKFLPIVVLALLGLAGLFLFNGDMRTSSAMDSNGALAEDIPSKVDEYLNAYVDQGRFSGAVLIAHDDEVIVRQGYNQADREHDVPNTPETKFRLGSVTKQFTAVAILQLQQQGELSVDDTLSTYMPDYPNGDRIRIHHLLRHTSGIPNYTSFDNYQQLMRRELSTDEIIKQFRDRDLNFEPGSQFSYSNSNYLLLGHLIEQISGQSYDSFLREHIFDPLGMANSGYDRRARILEHRAEGYAMEGDQLVHADFVDMSVPHGAGALYATVGDLLKWDEALETDQLLNDSLRETMFTPGKGDYGYGWFIDESNGRKRVHHSGGINGFVTNITRFPDEDVLIVALSNFMHAPLGEIRQGLSAIVFGEEYQLPQEHTAVQLDPSVLERYVGTYRLDEQTTIEVTRKGDHLGIQISGQPQFDLYASSKTEFFIKAIGAEVTFVTDDSGAVTKLIIHQGGQDIPAERISGDPNAGNSSDG